MRNYRPEGPALALPLLKKIAHLELSQRYGLFAVNTQFRCDVCQQIVRDPNDERPVPLFRRSVAGNAGWDDVHIAVEAQPTMQVTAALATDLAWRPVNAPQGSDGANLRFQHVHPIGLELG